MDRHVVARAKKHHVLNAILAAPANPVQMMALARELLVQRHRLLPAKLAMAFVHVVMGFDILSTSRRYRPAKVRDPLFHHPGVLLVDEP